MLGWAGPGLDRFSVLPVFVSRLLGNRRFDFTTDTNGSHRALYPLGSYERVMPMDIVATYLLRAIVVGDIEEADALAAAGSIPMRTRSSARRCSTSPGTWIPPEPP